MSNRGKKQMKYMIMAENFEQLITANKPKIQEAYKVPTKINTKNSTTTHIIFTPEQKTRDKKKI